LYKGQTLRTTKRTLSVSSASSPFPFTHLTQHQLSLRLSFKMAGGIPINTTPLSTGFLKGRALIFPLSLVISLFFLWGFSYGLLDVLNKHFQNVLKVTKLQSTGLQVVYFGGGYLLFSPIAAETLKRRGYKITILMGLSLYSLGAIMFWVWPTIPCG
jgi:fucose permease